MSKEASSRSGFAWACLALAVLTIGITGWMVNDLRVAVKSNIQRLDEHLPEILANTKRSSETLAVLSDDIKQLRDLAGVSNGTRDRSLVVFADSLLDELQESKGKVGLKPKLFGKALKDTELASDWVVQARKEALWLSFRSKSKTELIERLCKNKFGSDWYTQEGEGDPELLMDWFRAKELHPEPNKPADE